MIPQGSLLFSSRMAASTTSKWCNIGPKPHQPTLFSLSKFAPKRPPKIPKSQRSLKSTGRMQTETFQIGDRSCDLPPHPCRKGKRDQQHAKFQLSTSSFLLSPFLAGGKRQNPTLKEIRPDPISPCLECLEANDVTRTPHRFQLQISVRHKLHLEQPHLNFTSSQKTFE